MYAVITCLRDEHDLRLVLIAAVICIVSALAGFGSYHRAIAARRAAVWMLGPGLIAGMGVWATHFMAMLAYQPMMDIGYQLDLTLGSMIAPVLGMSAAFVLVRGRAAPELALAGGLVAGLSVAVMHFMGVAAVRLPAVVTWDYVLAAIACVVCVAGASLAFLVDQGRARERRAGPLLMAAAICSLHFTAMGAVILRPDASLSLEGDLISRQTLALATGCAVLLILGAAVAIQLVERLTQRATLSALAGALDSAPSALAFFDGAQRLIFWNAPYARALALYGVEPQEGMSIATIGQRLSASEPLQGSLKGGGLSRRSLEKIVAQGVFPTPDGRMSRIEVGDTPDGGFVLVMHDVTEQTMATQALARARDAAEAASRAKSDFLANMSHEVRTPLNGVLGMAQVMERHPLSDAQRERLSIIRESGATLLTLLDDVLDIARIETGRLELESQDFDLAARVQAACAPFVPEAEAKGVTFAVEISPDIQGFWRGDGARIAQMVTALVSNGLKFTEHGEVRVHVTHKLDLGVAITITDTGVGMAEEDLGRLFEPFAQADASATRRYGGAGLGLTMTHHLASMMGGTLQAASRIGDGSTFTLALPLSRGAPTEAPEREDPPPLRILAAEDNPTNQQVLTALLGPLGADLVLVDNGRAAVEAFSHGGFELVLMDIQMPGMNGIEAARAIRAREAEQGMRRTPILAVTANVMTHQLQEYSAVGMDGAVAKPLRGEALLQAIMTALGATELADARSVAGG
ncbi:ATP-binding protein [Phenylobacterium sp.]|jgi:signal transduction histidine kinase|uniref:ATP-binding protein n=1 Tax=Phenylobacterium sp. TaxID=1871053 RepID=UPI000C924A9C|nr:ATP-binding protein [Phenylobacterium sp.]MAK82937.1 hybrid sensor histidine kinase/response regulator [Phenylobacterium sp.]|tara:strand:- start:8094 stop:10340 length:2247 start_codon:yes stop_codon:yes gene_type:complete